MRLRVQLVVLIAGALAPSHAGAQASACGAVEPSRLLAAATERYRAQASAEAVRLYHQYLACYPDRADVRFFLGAALVGLNRLPEAAAEAQRSLALDPNYARAYALLGRVHTAERQWDAAEQTLRFALELDPADRDAWYFLGRAYLESNRFEQAITAFQRALALKAEFARTYEGLGRAHEALGQDELAEKAYARAAELAGGDYRPFYLYGAFLAKRDRTAESLRWLRLAVARQPQAAEAHFELGRVLLRLGQLEPAAAEVRSALRLSDDCSYRYVLARIYLLQGKAPMSY